MAFDRRRKRDEYENDSGLQDNVVKIYRVSKVVKGGRKFSFGCLVVVGDEAGKVGLGFGKANEVPAAVEKAKSDAMKRMIEVPLVKGTIPHEVIGKFGASRVVMLPASPGTGVIAGKMIRSLFELAGIENLLTKAYGSTSPQNLLKAGMDALKKLRTAEQVAELRGVEVG